LLDKAALGQWPLLGRYWHSGPQQRCPGVWLQEGDNDVLVLDLHRIEPAPDRERGDPCPRPLISVSLP